jgi:hypothetical protein
LVSGKYFNKGVKALDAPDLGHVVRETPDKIVVFGGKDQRYDIPISEIKQVGANVLIGLPLSEIEKNIRLVGNNHYLQVVKILGQITIVW